MQKTAQQKKLRVSILGSGNIGADLLVKVVHSHYLECTKFIGRNLNSNGMLKAAELNVPVSDQSINAIIDEPDCCDLVFDATSARDHLHHSEVLKKMGKMVIDMTPSKIGEMMVPAIDGDDRIQVGNINMISCGGQASIPLAHVIGKAHGHVEYIEVVSSIASKSAGPATRINLDEYIETTEAGVRKYSGCDNAKSIIILNPAEPCVDMQTTVSAKIAEPNMGELNLLLDKMLNKIQRYVPGYKLIVPPVYDSNRVVIMVRVKGRGDYLPTYAGNLDIINCAAIAAAEQYAKQFLAL